MASSICAGKIVLIHSETKTRKKSYQLLPRLYSSCGSRIVLLLMEDILVMLCDDLIRENAKQV
jgi:hypothetical protein